MSFKSEKEGGKESERERERKCRKKAQEKQETRNDLKFERNKLTINKQTNRNCQSIASFEVFFSEIG